MTRPKSLQVHVSFELAERVRSAAERRDISMSEWIRSLLQQACDEDDLKIGLSAWMQRMHRQPFKQRQAVREFRGDESAFGKPETVLVSGSPLASPYPLLQQPANVSRDCLPGEMAKHS